MNHSRRKGARSDVIDKPAREEEKGSKESLKLSSNGTGGSTGKRRRIVSKTWSTQLRRRRRAPTIGEKEDPSIAWRRLWDTSGECVETDRMRNNKRASNEKPSGSQVVRIFKVMAYSMP